MNWKSLLIVGNKTTPTLISAHKHTGPEEKHCQVAVQCKIPHLRLTKQSQMWDAAGLMLDKTSSWKDVNMTGKTLLPSTIGLYAMQSRSP